MLYSAEQKEDEGMFGRKEVVTSTGQHPSICLNICGKTSQNQLKQRSYGLRMKIGASSM
jgi:hypothetical protein